MGELLFLALVGFAFILGIKILLKSIEFLWEYAFTIAILILLFVIFL